MSPILLIIFSIFNMACDTIDAEENLDKNKSIYAVVEKVTVSGKEGKYSFSVTLKSPDKGCQQYADWWEVLSGDGDLIYRRILAHSHVNEQPFSRSGGTVNISAKDVVIVRGHMNASGYGDGEVAMKGSASAGFQSFAITKDFAVGVEKKKPQPNGCAF